jgi:hypothetical protein
MDSIKEAKETEHFTFGSTSADLRTPRRNVQREIKGDFLDKEKTIDAFEQSKGFARKPKVDVTKFEFKTVILDPEKQHDNDLLNMLLNEDKYVITYYKDNWTPQGNYRVFIIYGKKKEDES